MKNGIEKTTSDKIVLQKTDKEIVAHQNGVVESDYDIDSFLEKRAEFITKVKAIMVEGKDYHVIQGKKSLAKGGAEKIASIFGWQAEFIKDEAVLEAFKTDGLIAFVCNLSKMGNSVGQGRGAATLVKNNQDPNKTIKMAQKSAFIDAVLRASGLSDFFTQDLEDMPANTVQPTKMQTPDAEYYCSVHDLPLVMQPAGKTRQGDPYPAFWKCSEKPKYGHGKYCYGPFTNSDGLVVKQNKETGEMEVQKSAIMGTPLGKTEEGEIVLEFPNYKPNHEGD